MFCTQCGASNPDNASFCSACGKSIAASLMQSPAVAVPIEAYAAAPNIELPRTPAAPVASATQTPERTLHAHRPFGVTVLAVLAFLGFIATVSLAMAVLSVAASASAVSDVPLMRFLMQLFPVLALGQQDMVSQASEVATSMFVIAAICAVQSYGLWKRRKWGRILAIVSSALLSLHAAAMIFAASGIFLWHVFALGINIWIIAYLLKSHVKQAFGA
jgi:uncharacterized membrane protein (DUF2068 family)